jgi:hypothetical protein
LTLGESTNLGDISELETPHIEESIGNLQKVLDIEEDTVVEDTISDSSSVSTSYIFEIVEIQYR